MPIDNPFYPAFLQRSEYGYYEIFLDERHPLVSGVTTYRWNTHNGIKYGLRRVSCESNKVRANAIVKFLNDTVFRVEV